MCRKLCFLMSLVLVLGLTPAVHALVNADFEGGSYLHWSGQQIPNSWDAHWNSLDGWGGPSVVHSSTEGGGNNFLQADVNATASGGYAVCFQHGTTLASLGVSPGETVSLTADIIDLVVGGGSDGAILKMESWDDIGLNPLDALEVQIPGITSSWANYSMDYTVFAGATKLTAVVGTSTGWGGPNPFPSSFGFDNVVIVPEPMTIALLGLGALMALRRRRHQ